MKLSKYFFWGVFETLFFIIESTNTDVWNNIQNLRKKLLKDYDKKISPHGSSNGTTLVKFDVIVKHILVDEKNEVFTLSSFVLMVWNDNRLKWNVSDFGERQIYFENNELWKPDLAVINNAKGTDIDHFENSKFFVFEDGLVLWIPPAIFSVPCTLDLKFWPYDTQKCRITLMSGTYDGLQVNVQLFHNVSQMSSYRYASTKHSWTIIEAKKVRHAANYDETREYFISLDLNFIIKRNCPTFWSFVAVPSVAIPLFLMIQFILPVDHPKRLLIGYVCSVLVMMELFFLKISLPKLGTSVPLIVSYFSECFIIVILTIVSNSILGRLTHPVNPLLDFPPPEPVKNVVTGHLATILCVRIHASKVGMSGDVSDDVEALAERNTNYSHEWLLVAKVVDRISLILILCIFIFSLFCYVAPIH